MSWTPVYPHALVAVVVAVARGGIDTGTRDATEGAYTVTVYEPMTPHALAELGVEGHRFTFSSSINLSRLNLQCSGFQFIFMHLPHEPEQSGSPIQAFRHLQRDGRILPI